MEISFQVDLGPAFKQLDHIDQAIIVANNNATVAAATAVLPIVKANLSFHGKTAPIGQLGTRTGLLLHQTRAKYFKTRAGLMAAALKVIGRRAFVMRINERGARSHGGRRPSRIDPHRRRKVRAGARADRGPLRARQVFALTYRMVAPIIMRAYTEIFEQSFDAAVPKMMA